MERASEGAVRLWAPAKLNLNLLVGPRRPDGYHPLDSLVAAVSLYDRIELRPRDDGRIVLTVGGCDCGPDERNLAFLAARAVQDRFQCGGCDVDLTKAIPPGKGLAGGSSDAAAVLAGLNELYGLKLSPAKLGSVGSALGSDVPLFFGAPAVRMTGRGECIEPWAVHPFLAVLILPVFACGTADVYRAYDEAPSGEKAQLDDAVLATQPPSVWRRHLLNDLAEPAGRVCPALAELRGCLSARIEAPVHVTGSGSGLFVLCDDAAEAGRFASTVRRETAGSGADVVIVQPAE